MTSDSRDQSKKLTLQETEAKTYKERIWKYYLRKNIVPLFFIVLCVFGGYYSGLSLPFLINEIITRMARNSFLVISLIIPILAGMGLNFGIVLGAMAGQFGYIATANFQMAGFSGFAVTTLISIPLSILFGWLTGKLFNQAKGKEMITGIILGFFANGIYQLICLYFMGNFIPIRVPTMLLSTGVGLRNTLDIKSMHYALDNLWKIRIKIPGMIFPIVIPVFTLLAVVVLCVAIHFLIKTKLGQEFRAVGQNRHIAEVAGIKVDKIRVIAIIFSTVLAGIGQVIFLQNLGNINTYGSHVQVGTFAVAAILIGGASVSRATIGQALLGTLLFHTLFIVSPLAGKNLIGDAMIGEYFRVFVTYGVIGLALALHAWQARQKRR
ncbi:MAG TPA: ABC transporter permease [Synergistales bacterium]|nr:MAG: Inner-membrane translocator [Synergistales bacterium 57_84]KUK85456.1 MAG: Inner-membrane translocator [Synergistales bacterium 58_81]HCP07310.1 ABC transporter permease [Synergistaceae bacterium]HQO83346.1 ABC transporter permease [Synergistales bacterium]